MALVVALTACGPAGSSSPTGPGPALSESAEVSQIEPGGCEGRPSALDDPRDPRLIYAVYSLMPYSEVWRAANEGGNLLARIDPISLAGGLSFCVLVLIGGGLAVRHLARRRAVAHSPR